ncbi:DUF7266 family protein [Halarchaeum acidiphilum]|uniref:DUF7266 family protein n=1 Tax=Halarchaeum acidiphilum TaxID=489138 RepID=UPI000362420C|nr:hypothetical protein [Halarchaeum acidiphilum]
MADVTADRGVSTVVGYVLNLGIALLLVTGLLITTSGFVADQRHRAVEEGLGVVASHLAGDLATIDRLASTSDAEHVAVRADVPEQVAGRAYTIHVSPDGNTTKIQLVETRTGVTVTRSVHTSLTVSESTRGGGSLRFVYDDDGSIEVADD